MSDPAGQATVDDALPASNGGRGAFAGEKPGLIGVIAGMGRFPVLLVERLRAGGYEVVVSGGAASLQKRQRRGSIGTGGRGS